MACDRQETKKQKIVSIRIAYISSMRYGGEGKAALIEAETDGVARAGPATKRATARPHGKLTSCTIANSLRCRAYTAGDRSNQGVVTDDVQRRACGAAADVWKGHAWRTRQYSRVNSLLATEEKSALRPVCSDSVRPRFGV